MIEWEYRIAHPDEIHRVSNNTSLSPHRNREEQYKATEEILNAWGSEGWELVGRTDDPFVGLWYYTFKRRKE